ncbi:response regulator transcription factor [Neobacillus sp.]|uniref:response regulator transcription factor n=1 Tax=Neobacillus sp. TaxID=2675273 RepID=UPI00289E9423|nr:response regulator transcription factor [Neobacillus sp.]
MFKVLIVEDERKIAEIVGETMKSWGYEPCYINNFQKVDEEFMLTNPHLILLDINLPYYNGFYWCEKIRRLSNVPIIFLSSRTEQMDMMMAINMGGDDFIQKPFSMEMLLTKINAILRRTYTYQAKSLELLCHRDLTLNLKTATAIVDDKEMDLTKNEFKILSVLFEHTNKIVSRDKLMQALWESESYIDDNTLTVNVNRLRRKLNEAGIGDYIQTKKGQGYMLA